MLISSGGYLKANGFLREAKVGTINQWLEQAEPFLAKETLFSDLKERFETVESNIQTAITARSKERLKNLLNTLQRKEQQEIKNITQVLDELSQSIHNELKVDNEPFQLLLEGFSEDERTQIRRDNEALKRRLKQIPKEKEEEKKNIKQRYAKLYERTFPVAVILLVPQSLQEKQV